MGTGPAPGPASSCRCFSLWGQTGCEGSWGPCLEGWGTQGVLPELGGSWEQRADSINAQEEIRPGLSPWSPPAAPLPAASLGPPTPYSYKAAGGGVSMEGTKLWKLSLNFVAPVRVRPGGESPPGPESCLRLAGHEIPHGTKSVAFLLLFFSF